MAVGMVAGGSEQVLEAGEEFVTGGEYPPAPTRYD